jgi:hypothetical protein
MGTRDAEGQVGRALNQRIAFWVGLGIALLIVLGVAASLVVIAGIRETVRRNQLSQSAALEVRAIPLPSKLKPPTRP